MSAKAEAYQRFLEAKVVAAPARGFCITDDDVNPACKPHVRAIVPWLVGKGRAACFSVFGMQKTSTQLEAVRLTLAHAGGRGLIVCPLNVRGEFRRDATELLGWAEAPRFIRSTEDIPEGDLDSGVPEIYLTNWESVRDGKIDPRLFNVVSFDEADALRSFGSKTFGEVVIGSWREVPYIYLASATPDPNDYVELLGYAQLLGVMDIGQAKTRFFRRDSEKADNLTLHPHKTEEFWLWMASWACVAQRPSDLCACPCHREKTYSDSDSDGSSSKDGRQAPSATAHGDAGANAAAPSSRGPATSSAESSLVAAACVQSTAEKVPGRTASGAECWNAAQGQPTRTGPTTVAAESPSASDGLDSPTSSPTWDTPQPVPPSSASTTTAATSPATADGPRVPTRPVTGGLEAATPSRNGTRAAATCDSCREDDAGYNLPPLDIRWHEIPSDHADAGSEKSGQLRLHKNVAVGVGLAAREKRSSLGARVAKLLELRAEDPAAHRIIWHDLEAERKAIERAVPGVVSIYGSQDLDERAAMLDTFAAGQAQELAAKPVMLGVGVNLQRHCAWEIFLGIGYKFRDVIQAIHRCHRFGQTRRVRVDFIYTEAERAVRLELEAKWARYAAQTAHVAGVIRELGLAQVSQAAALQRSIGVTRQEAAGERFRLINNDTVVETMEMESDSVDLIVTSPPFSTQYEYTPSYNDFGHTDTVEHFWAQMDFLTPELLRVLRPGRCAIVHMKDRVVPSGMTGLGFQVVHPFHAEAITHFGRHGFAFLGMKTIVTDVVRENNQTYRLGYSEQCKDGSRMGAGLPEYLLIFRKPPTDRSNGYADVPVVKSKEEYSRGRWQFDAHGFMRSSGERLLTPEEIVRLPWKQIFRLFREYSGTHVYDFEHDVALAEALETNPRARLPTDFMLLQPVSWHPDVWTDITRMRTLNGAQAQRLRSKHLCPFQVDVVERVIRQFSQPGEIVFDPFSGLGTVPMYAVRLGRRGLGCELNAAYFADSVAYCEGAERELRTPTMFDLATDPTEEIA